MKSVSSSDQKIINNIVNKTKVIRENNNSTFATIEFEDLLKILNKKEIELINRYLKIDPKKFGINANYLGILPVPDDLVVIKNQKYLYKQQKRVVPPQYLPKKVYMAYKKLNRFLANDLGKKLLIESGYRSPTYQMMTVLYYLKFLNFDLLKTLKRVAMVGYSEHTFPHRQALDFMTTDGIPRDEKPLLFVKTLEYKWLLKNANKFGFYLSYPKDNSQRIMFEPWHWHFEG